jgi:hypothetical protein
VVLERERKEERGREELRRGFRGQSYVLFAPRSRLQKAENVKFPECP